MTKASIAGLRHTCRLLVVTADDFGIGLNTSRGILELATAGIVTSTVLLVNSPFAAQSVDLWNDWGRPVELGWHPCLTLDAPTAPATRIPSLVGRNGRFHSLGSFLRRLAFGRILEEEVEIEFAAQRARFIELVGAPPQVVNAHHHVNILPTIRRPLLRILATSNHRAFMRRVVVRGAVQACCVSAMLKRAYLNGFGADSARRQTESGHAGCDELLGLVDSRSANDPAFFTSILRRCVGRVVELMCHPGDPDPELKGRDEKLQRVLERDRLRRSCFLEAVAKAGFRLVPAAYVSNELIAGGIDVGDAITGRPTHLRSAAY